MEYLKLTDGIEIKKVLQAKKSNTTESFYILFKDENNDVYQLAVSDHFADNHSFSFDGDIDDLSDELIDILKNNDFNSNSLIDDLAEIIDELDYDGCYGFEKAEKYDEEKVKALIGKSNLDKALSGETYDLKIETAKLIENNQVLKINGSDLSINYLPKVEDDKFVEKIVENEVTTKDYYNENENFMNAQDAYLMGE